MPFAKASSFRSEIISHPQAFFHGNRILIHLVDYSVENLLRQPPEDWYAGTNRTRPPIAPLARNHAGAHDPPVRVNQMQSQYSAVAWLGTITETERREARLECVWPCDYPSLSQDNLAHCLDRWVTMLDAVNFRQVWRRENRSSCSHGFFCKD